MKTWRSHLSDLGVSVEQPLRIESASGPKEKLIMRISLTENLESLVKSKVESGLYNNASEVVREALRLMHQRDEAQRARYAQFKREAVLGYEQGQRGESTTPTPEEIAQAVEDRHHAPQS